MQFPIHILGKTAKRLTSFHYSPPPRYSVSSTPYYYHVVIFSFIISVSIHHIYPRVDPDIGKI